MSTDYEKWTGENKVYQRFIEPHILKYDEARGMGWISVSEGIPVNHPLIVAMKDKGVWVATLLQETSRHKPKWVDIDTNEINANVIGVTHWMPLPRHPDKNKP